MSPNEEATLLRDYDEWRRACQADPIDTSVEAFIESRHAARTLEATTKTIEYLREVAFTDAAQRPSAADVAEHIVVDLFGEPLS